MEETPLLSKEKMEAYAKEVPSPLTGPIPPLSQYLIRKNLKELITISLEDITLFTNTNFIKLKAFQRLYFSIFYAQVAVVPFFDKLLRTLVRYQRDEDKEIALQVTRIAELLGVFVPPQSSVPIVLSQINELEVSNTRTLISYMSFLASVFRFEQPKEVDFHMPVVLKTLELIEGNYKDEAEVLEAMYPLVETLIKNAGEGVVIYTRPFFSLLLSIQATVVSLSLPNKHNLQASFELLAGKSGYTSVAELHSNEISVFLSEITQRKTQINWSKSSKERFKFEVIVRNCKEGIKPFLNDIFRIIKDATSASNDIETRMDMLVLLEFLLEMPPLKPEISTYSLFILTNILIPSAVWRAGKPNIKIRKAGIINILHLIKSEIIPASCLFEGYKELLPVLKSCLDDDWAPDLRFASCQLLEKLLVTLHELLDSEQLRELYPILLQRLDDAQDLIRIEVTKAFTAFFACKNVAFSEGTFEYLVKNVIVHLDDQNEDIQMAIYHILRFAARLKPKIVLTEAKQVLKKQKYPRKCQDLIKLCEELVEETEEEGKK